MKFQNEIKDVADFILNIKQDFVDNLLEYSQKSNNGDKDIYFLSKKVGNQRTEELKLIRKGIVVKQLYNRACGIIDKKYDEKSTNSFISNFNLFFLELFEKKFEVLYNEKGDNQKKERSDPNHKYWNDYIDMMILLTSNITLKKEVLVTGECKLLNLLSNKKKKAIIHHVDFLSCNGFSKEEITFFHKNGLPENKC